MTIGLIKNYIVFYNDNRYYKLIKNYPRLSTSQKRLASEALSIIAVENDVLEKINVQIVMNDFVSKKFRKDNIKT